MNKLQIIPLGGMGNVTKNLFLYEYEDEMLIVDCGIGFPEASMLGVDLLIPDVSYIQKRIQEGAKIVGLCLTHGHDDHIAALPYVLQMLQVDFPLYGSKLTAAFAQARMAEFEVQREVHEYPSFGPVRFGKYFSVEPVGVTHSVPDTKHLIIRTPEGIVYHGSDFKFDMTPVDGNRTEFGKIAAIGQEGVLCALVDCLRVEREKWSPSESTIRETFEREIRDCKGKFIITLMSSNLHRVQQAIDVAAVHDRKVVFVGRSIEQNVKIAEEIGMMHIPKGVAVHKRHMKDYPDRDLCVIIAGSQGQPGSSLVRAVYGEHPIISIGKQDKVVFSTEAIPGNESNVYGTIDELSRNNITVLYSDVDDGLHVSGHAGLIEQQLIISLLHPKYLFPIGGTDRHRVLFSNIAQQMGYREDRVLIPEHGVAVECSGSAASYGNKIILKELMVDGLGVGDVGTVVLSDRKKMAEEGMIVVIIPEIEGSIDLSKISVISRGFVFMQDADEVVEMIKEKTRDILHQKHVLQFDDNRTVQDETALRKEIEKALSDTVNQYIGRTPLILPVFLEM